MLDDNMQVYVSKNGTILLTQIEYKILKLLIDNKGTIVTHQMISQDIWNCNIDKSIKKVISLHISRIRKKINNEFKIATRNMIGYYLKL